MSQPSPAQPAPAVAPTLSIVICCYTARRLDQLHAAVLSAVGQLGADDEVIVVVDHNPDLFATLHADITVRDDRVRVLANTETNGLSGARNTGVGAAVGGVVVFLDDDAAFDAGALDAVRNRFAGTEVIAIGGAVLARWSDDAEPGWFPSEFGWVVGCDYRGLPADGATIRNPIGAAMAVRREALVEIGGFSRHLGRRGTFPAGCEETLMGIVLHERFPSSVIVRDTGLRVHHHVPRDRATFDYFLRRCYQEGRSKAILAKLTSADSALSSERGYATRTLPSGVWLHRRQPLRVLALVVGLAVTTAGFVTGTVNHALHRRTGEDVR